MRKTSTCILIFLSIFGVKAQTLTLDDAIYIAKERSYDAQKAKFSFLASYWTYRSFKAELMPSVNIQGTLLNFNHSIVETRNYADGQIAYVNNNTLANNLILSLDQKIAATGGTISIQSYAHRLDQFSYHQKTYNVQPLRISYSQPLRSFNTLKWEKKIVPVEYEAAQRIYISSMEDIAVQVTNLFFDVLSAQYDYKQSLYSMKDREKLLDIARKRLELGTTTKSEVLQLELSLQNAKVTLDQDKLSLDSKRYDLFSYLMMNDDSGIELALPPSINNLWLSPEVVVDKALSNSVHQMEQQITRLEAEKNLAQAKANRGIQVTLSGEIGFAKSDERFFDAYGRLKDNEIVGLTISMPIFDWGMGRGKVKVAKAQLDVTRTRLEQEHKNYIHDLRRKVLQFNSRPSQYSNAIKAQEIAEERYGIAVSRFEAGTTSVTELNTALSEMESANRQYITMLHNLWSDYYAIRKATLYDWIGRRELQVDFGTLIK